MMRFRHSTAFTLIELLFIIVIFGLIATLILASYQQRTTNQKIEKTGIEMQQFLQAAFAYYNDNACWPGACGSNAPNFNNYLPATGPNPQQPTNPWGQPYVYGYNPVPNTFYIRSGSLTANKTPSLNDYANAKRLVSLLPNSSLYASDLSQVVVTVTGNTSGKYPVIGAIGQLTGLVNGSNGRINFSCPGGYKNAWLIGAIRDVSPANYPTYDPPRIIVRERCPGGSGPIGVLNLQTFWQQGNQVASNCTLNNGIASCPYTFAFSANIPDPSYTFGVACHCCSYIDYTKYPNYSTYPGTANFTYIGWCAP